MFASFRCAVAAALLLAICANSSSLAQGSVSTPVRPQDRPVPPAAIPNVPAPPPAVLNAPASAPPAVAAPVAEPAPAEPAAPTIEPATGVAITWAVVNRFRLFRDERDFRRHAEATQGRTVLEAERALAVATEGRGWARDLVGRLCLDNIGRIEDQCVRDGVRENYLNPADHGVEMQLAGVVPAGAACAWNFAVEGAGAHATASADCAAP